MRWANIFLFCLCWHAIGSLPTLQGACCLSTENILGGMSLRCVVVVMQ